MPRSRGSLRAFVALLVLAAAACAPRPVRPPASATGVVRAAERGGMTVADRDRSIDYSRVLGFALVSYVEVRGIDVERVDGVAGARMRGAEMRLGRETIGLTEYAAVLGFSAATMVRDSDGHALRVLVH